MEVFGQTSLRKRSRPRLYVTELIAILSGSIGCAVWLETRSLVQSPLRSATFFRGDWSWNIFYGHSLPSADSRRAVAVSGERMCTILVNHLEDLLCPVNVWLGKLIALDMTPMGWLGRKPQHKQTNTELIWLGSTLFATHPGPTCSKLTTSLLNDSLKFTLSDTQICWNFLLKKCE